jgi:formylglycine-generating enzyme
MLSSPRHTNSVDMEFVRIEPGTFAMGNDTELPEDLARLPNRTCGDFDERPVRDVTISSAYYLGATPVTNAEYELFDPSHRDLRGKFGFSTEDNEVVLFVNWHEAVAYCEWLSAKDGIKYRLPTEAEWEYACRAGTDTPFWSGDTLAEEWQSNQRVTWWPAPMRSDEKTDVMPLHVGCIEANPFGLKDMHGLVEEWCYDWYGPYSDSSQRDPVGPTTGDFRVTRGGSHSTETYFLRSTNRMATLPDERTWLIGFRVAIAEPLESIPSGAPPNALHQQDVRQDVAPGRSEGESTTPYFYGPKVFMRIPPGSEGPIFSAHNHVPSIVECPNGDVLSAWYSCREESGREVAIAGSRLRKDADTGSFPEQWDGADLFWKVPDRCKGSVTLWNDGLGSIWHFSGLSAGGTYGSLAVTLRKSSDNGATWSPARLVIPEHGIRQLPVTTIFRAQDGSIVLPCDAVVEHFGGTALWISRDEGITWHDAGGEAAGIHAAVAQLGSGRLLAFGRGDEVDGMMPMSFSDDMGATWNVQASIFPPVTRCQRPVMLKLKTGELLFASFSNNPEIVQRVENKPKERMRITDRTGAQRRIDGLFCALSEDDGETWSVIRPLTDDEPEHEFESFDGGIQKMNRSKGEWVGYLCAIQSEDGLIHIGTSRNHYVVNRAWLHELPPGVV